MQVIEKNCVRSTLGLLLSGVVALPSFALAATQQEEIDALKQQIQQIEKNQNASQKLLDSMSKIKTNPITFNGFASIGLSQISESGLDIEYNTGQGSDLSLLPTTYAGIQMHVDLYDSGEFVYQVVAKGTSANGNNAFDLETEWLYLKQDLGANFNMQVGRIRFPAFMDSENYYIGTTYPWITPPTEIYEVLPITNIDGISINHSALLGDWMLSSKMLLWGESSQGTDSYTLYLNDVYGLSFNLSNDSLSLRLAYMAAEEEIAIDFEGNKDDDAASGTLYDSMNETFGDDLEYLIASIRYDDGLMFVSAEGVDIKAKDGLLDENRNWNITTGVHIGPVLLYVGYSETKVTNDDELAGNLSEHFDNAEIKVNYDVGGGMVIPVDYSKGALLANYLNRQQHTSTIGIKYDFVPKATFKVQVQYMDDFDDTAGNFSGGSSLPFEDVYIYDIAVQAFF